jgi:hypothetical protein
MNMMITYVTLSPPGRLVERFGIALFLSSAGFMSSRAAITLSKLGTHTGFLYHLPDDFIIDLP